MLLRGELRDPRLTPASAVTVTGVEVSGDLSVARVFVDVLTETLRLSDVLAGLRAGGGVMRRKLGVRLKLRRLPELRFEQDTSITRGARVEAILAELRDRGELSADAAASSTPELAPESVSGSVSGSGAESTDDER